MVEGFHGGEFREGEDFGFGEVFAELEEKLKQSFTPRLVHG